MIHRLDLIFDTQEMLARLTSRSVVLLNVKVQSKGAALARYRLEALLPVRSDRVFAG